MDSKPEQSRHNNELEEILSPKQSMYGKFTYITINISQMWVNIPYINDMG